MFKFGLTTSPTHDITWSINPATKLSHAETELESFLVTMLSVVFIQTWHYNQ